MCVELAGSGEGVGVDCGGVLREEFGERQVIGGGGADEDEAKVVGVGEEGEGGDVGEVVGVPEGGDDEGVDVMAEEEVGVEEARHVAAGGVAVRLARGEQVAAGDVGLADLKFGKDSGEAGPEMRGVAVAEEEVVRVVGCVGKAGGVVEGCEGGAFEAEGADVPTPGEVGVEVEIARGLDGFGGEAGRFAVADDDGDGCGGEQGGG